MNTEIIKITENVDSSELLARAGQIIREGGLVAFPTETVYGLGGNALDPEASRKIYAAKGRPSDNPLIVHISDVSQVENVAAEFPAGARKLAEAFWPGPMTLILKKRPEIPDETTGGLNTVAVRLPSNKIARDFIDAAGVPIAGPSANLSGRPSPTTANHVIDDLSGRIDMIIDGGASDIGLESTIIDCTGDVPMVLRPGFILPDQVEELLGQVELDKVITADTIEEAQTEGGPKAPGMKYKHYAPKAPLTLVEGEGNAVIKKIIALAKEGMISGKRIGVMASSETVGAYQVALSGAVDDNEDADRRNIAIVRSFGSNVDATEAASKLFALLREMDAETVDAIYSETLPEEGLGASVMNRMKKAAGFDIIRLNDEEPRTEGEAPKDTDYYEVIFVDAANNTMSIICESLFNYLRRGKDVPCSSRGTDVLFSEPVNEKAASILAEHGLKAMKAESQLLESKDIHDKTLILTLSETEKRKVLKTFPEANFVYTLAEFAGESKNLEAPVGTREAYEECYQKLLNLVIKAVEFIVINDESDTPAETAEEQTDINGFYGENITEE